MCCLHLLPSACLVSTLIAASSRASHHPNTVINSSSRIRHQLQRVHASTLSVSIDRPGPSKCPLHLDIRPDEAAVASALCTLVEREAQASIAARGYFTLGD
jgi:hypothetical protein